VKKTSHLHIRIDPSLLDSLRALAERRGQTVTQLVTSLAQTEVDRDRR